MYSRSVVVFSSSTSSTSLKPIHCYQISLQCVVVVVVVVDVVVVTVSRPSSSCETAF